MSRALSPRNPTSNISEQQYQVPASRSVLTPQPQFFPGRRPAQQQPQQQADDGYIYPADGSSTDQRYPAPRSSRRAYDGQAYYQQQPQPSPMAKRYQQPQRGYYYQQRGLY